MCIELADADADVVEVDAVSIGVVVAVSLQFGHTCMIARGNNACLLSCERMIERTNDERTNIQMFFCERGKKCLASNEDCLACLTEVSQMCFFWISIWMLQLLLLLLMISARRPIPLCSQTKRVYAPRKLHVSNYPLTPFHLLPDFTRVNSYENLILFVQKHFLC